MLAQTAVSLPFVFLIALSFTAICYYMIGLNGKVDRFFFFVIDLFLSLYAAESMVVAISTIVPSFIVGIAIAAGAFGMFMLVCGFFLLADNIPNYWIWAHYISQDKYSFEAFMYNEFDGESYECDKGTQSIHSCTFFRTIVYPRL